jgi:hypothetical protein
MVSTGGKSLYMPRAGEKESNTHIWYGDHGDCYQCDERVCPLVRHDVEHSSREEREDGTEYVSWQATLIGCCA